jgi:hypothetical protein
VFRSRPRRAKVTIIVAKKLALIGAVVLLLDVVAAAAWAASRSSSTDTLSLRILRSYTSHQIKNAYVPVTAKGIYVIMDVAAKNNASRPVALGSDSIRLKLDGTKYVPASSGLQALELAGHKSLPGSSVGPAGTATGWLAFDVPLQAAASIPELCLDGATCLPAPAV